MPALIPTDFSARILWLGANPDREGGLTSTSMSQMILRFTGFPGESHSGHLRASCGRVTALYPRGTEIRNTRQLSIVSAEDLAQIAGNMSVERLDPSLLGASMVVQGIPEFSHIPPSSRLQGPDGATLTVDMENRPCNLPAKPIDADGPGNGKAFKTSAKGRRGITAWVEREGTLKVGDTLRLFIPAQPVWKYLDKAQNR